MEAGRCGLTNMTLISLGSNLGAKQHEPDVAMNPHGGHEGLSYAFLRWAPACLFGSTGGDGDGFSESVRDDRRIARKKKSPRSPRKKGGAGLSNGNVALV